MLKETAAGGTTTFPLLLRTDLLMKCSVVILPPLQHSGLCALVVHQCKMMSNNL